MPSSGATGVAVGGHNGFSRGKTIFVLAVVVGCFAVLWPRIFYPMFTASLIGDSGDEVCCDVMSEKDTNAYHLMTEICGNILRRDSKLPPPLDSGQPGKKIEISKPAANLCRNEILKQCGVDVLLLLKENAAMTKEYKKSLNQIRSFNTSHCLKISYGVDVVEEIGLARMTKGPFSSPSHMRPERHLRPELMHPALREKGQAIPSPRVPRRTIDREARPGPVPGMRPPMAQAAHVPNTPKGSGTMGIVMPMYTFGIICFFVYTLMKLVSWYFMVNVTCDYVYSCLCILFKKPADEISPPVKPQPILKDLIDPDHRKYGAYSSSEDAYPNGSERSKKVVDDYKQKEDANRRKASAGAAAGKSDTFKGRLERETVSQEEDYSKDDDGDDEKSEIHNTDSWSPNETTTSSSYEPSSSSMEQDTMILAATKKAVPPTLTVQPPTPSTPPVASEIFVEPQKIPEVATIIEHDDNKTTTTTTPGDDKTDFFVDNPPQNPSDERLTPEQLTSAALFFDETIEISDADFEHVSCPTGKLDASRHDGQQEDKIDDELSPVISATPPSPQLVEYAGSLANRILADATSDASSPAQVVTQDVLLTKPGVSDNNVSIPAAGESSRKEDVCSQESHPGARDRDATECEQGFLVENSVERGILLKIKMLELSSLKTNNVGEVEIDSLRRQLEETQLAMERMITSMGSDRLAMLAKVLKAQGVDLEQPKGSIKEENKKSEEKAKLEPERKSSVKRHPSAEKEVTFQLPEAKKPEVEDDEEEEEVEEEEEEEEEPVRPPTPPRHGGSKKSKHNQHLSPSTTTTTNESTTNHTPVLVPPELILFAQQLSSHIIQQSAAAAIALAKQASSPQSQQHREILSVLGIEETAEMESGEKWDDRTPTPTFRMATPPVPHRAPSPPEDIPSIFLEGPLPMAGQQLMVSDSQVEMEGGDYGDDYENNTAPIILSGKVTLSVISGGGGAPDEITDASSLSYDDKGKNKNKTAIKAEKGLSNARKTPASTSHKEYEDIKKAEADNDGQNNKEDTEGDISVMGKIEELPKDEE
ncbi:uncharacterized protein LOC110853549 isoform X3 [Folsomia candida]|uniref:uncharacterized protein LOC110853549 isoform X3 n=1 Tax=Folsomia candida TaxID=158441 RepID=UPI001604F7AC|nr:uncharacterized protein LOC110853549 isoform X3 [Folsomia candida]